MARPRPDPLTPEEAKRRLRLRAQRASPAAWLRRHPYEALAAGAALGYLVGRCPAMVDELGRLLARRLLSRPR